MIALFFFIISIIGYIVSTVIEGIKIARVIAALMAALMSVPGIQNLLQGELPKLDRIESRQLPAAVIWVSENPLFKHLVASQLNGLALLEVGRDGKIRDLFASRSPYNGKTLAEFHLLSQAEMGQNLPVLFVDIANLGEAKEIYSAGPVFVYGEGSASISVRSNTAIVLANEDLSAVGSVLDAPLMVISKMAEGNGIVLKNSSNEQGLVKLIEFSQLRSSAQTLLQNMLQGQAPTAASFSLGDLGENVQTIEEEATASAAPLLSLHQRAWRRLSCEYGFFYVRCHLRFNREDMQAFLSQAITAQAPIHSFQVWGTSFDLSASRPRIFFAEQKLGMTLDLNVSRDEAVTESEESQGMLARVLALPQTTLMRTLPKNIALQNVEVVVDKINYNKETGMIYVTGIHVSDFGLNIGGMTSSNLAGFKGILLNVLNEILPRYFKDQPLYDLRQLRFFGIPLARFLLEKIEVDTKEEILGAQFRFGPQIFRSRRERSCQDLLRLD